MEGFRNKTYLTDPTGFRSKALSFNPILAGSQNRNFQPLALPDYVSYADLQARKAAEEAAARRAAAAVPQVDNGNDSYGDIGNDYWNGQYQGDGGGYNTSVNSGPGDFDSGTNWGYEDDYYSNDNDGGDHGGGGGGWGGNEQGDAPGSDAGTWNAGGTIPPMYAYDGLTKQERDRMAILAQQEAAKPKNTFGFTRGVPSFSQLVDNANYIKDNYDPEIGGHIDTVNDKIFKIVNPTYGNLISQGVKAGTQALTKSTPAGLAAGLIANELMKGMSNQQIVDKLNPFMSAQLYDAIYDFTDYDANPSQNDFIAEGQSKDYGVNVGTIPNIDMTDPSNYNIKDYVGIPEDPENYGAIFGNYSSPYTSGISSYNPAGINSWEDLGNYIKAGRQTNYNYGLTAEDTSYQEKVSQALADELSNPPTSSGNSGNSGSSSSNQSWGDQSWGDGGSYNDDGTDFGTNEYSGGQSTTGDAIQDAINDTDQFGLSKGGKIYASQGGYVNSTGGK